MIFNKLKKYQKVVTKIGKLEDEVSKLTQEEMVKKTEEFKNHIKTLDDKNDVEKYLYKILPMAFALVREAGRRTLNMRHFDVQLIGGQIIHEGDIAEMKTGEGKTLVITTSAYLNALAGKGVHVVTVNDYLAKRDMEKMSLLYNYLGIEVGLIQNDMTPSERQENYGKEITYVTNNEIGFDYLKDNMAKSKANKVLVQGLHYAIIDEVDSILIDEARTPLIISQLTEPELGLYIKADDFAKMIERGEKIESEGSSLEKKLTNAKAILTGDVIVDRKEKTINLTDQGILKAEKYFGIENLSDLENTHIMHHIMQALKANYLFTRDTDYLIRDGKVEIVDEFTGRVLKGRQYSEGLHQAIEAKERVEISPESKTLASITYQNLFNLYYKKSGMTGTGKTEEEEFFDIYKMLVTEVPTNKPIRRVDNNDLVYKTKKEKYLAIAQDVAACSKIGRPVLIGTPNIYVSEIIDEILNRMNIPHQVLNAKNHALEAEIISQAGQVGMITVATNMAGRGTDIIVSEDAKKLGGLKVIGVERHEARRIDDQLRGRTGRQGDVGESIFYLSLEDDLMKLFGSKSYNNMFDAMQIQYGEAIEHKILNKAIRNAQKAIEGMHFQSRKNVMKYDEIISKQRESIYKDRDKLLSGDVINKVYGMAEGCIESIINDYAKNKQGAVDGLEDEVNTEIRRVSTLAEHIHEEFKKHLVINVSTNIINELLGNTNSPSQTEIDILCDYIKDMIKEKFEGVSEEIISNHITYTTLHIVDNLWVEYLETLNEIQRGINLQQYKQQDPIYAFISETSETYFDLVFNIQSGVIADIFGTDFAAINKDDEDIEEETFNFDELITNTNDTINSADETIEE